MRRSATRAPCRPTPHFAQGWPLGPPDAEFQPSASYTLAAEGNDVYRCFVIPTHFGADRWVSALQVRPGNSSVVHHIIAYLDTHGARRGSWRQQATTATPATRRSGASASRRRARWAAGRRATRRTRCRPASASGCPRTQTSCCKSITTRTASRRRDLTRIGLYFAKGPVDKALHIWPLAAPLWIAPGDAHYTTHADLTVPADATLLEIMPHMHLLGRTMAVTATRPDGTAQPLVNVPDWDFNWQSTYVYKEPVKLPKGTKINLTATYDNSATNPRNPSSPPKLVTWGEQTTDEMCLAFLFYTVDAEHLTPGQPPPPGAVRM